MNIRDLLERCRSYEGCRVLPPAGPPVIAEHQRLPEDLAEFYNLCGGVELFKGRECGFWLCGPREFVLANPALLGDFYGKHKDEIDKDASANWYIVGRGIGFKLEVVTIDLGAKIGRCYESFWDVYATKNAKIVATSFTELFKRLWDSRGDTFYWHDREFGIGCAYPEDHV